MESKTSSTNGSGYRLYASNLETKQNKKKITCGKLGAATVVAIGQGANDAGMLGTAALGICVLSPEGTAVVTLMGADLVVANIYEALEILEKPLRIVATLRK